MKSLLFTLVALGTASAVACGMKNPDHSDIPTPGEVDPVAVESVEITEALTFDIGTSHTLTPTILPKNATNKDVTWTTSNSSAVSIDHNGRLNILAAGEVTITVTTDDGKKQDTCTITAVDPDAGKEYALVWAEEFGQEAAPRLAARYRFVERGGPVPRVGEQRTSTLRQLAQQHRGIGRNP